MKTILITGGSSGIGYEMSRFWAKDGYRILWVSHQAPELKLAKEQLEKEIPNVEIHTLVKDLSQSQISKDVYNWANKIARVDVLINNAGFGTHGFTNDMSIEKEVAMIQLHITTLYTLTRLFLKDMVQRDAGTIINISSNSSFQPVARMNTYASTKAFVKHFSRGLQEELELIKSNTKVITVCPAAIANTAFKDQINKIKTFKGLAATTKEEVAKDVWNGFKKGKTFVVSGWKMRLIYSIKFLIPYSVQQFMVKQETALSK